MALPLEARPLIDHWRLSPRLAGGLRLYECDQLLLVQTGLGKLAAAASVAAALHGHGPFDAVLNIGLAGADLPLGVAVLAHAVEDVASGRCWYPHLPSRKATRTADGDALPTLTVRTVDRPESHYSPGHAIDMEAAGVFAAAVPMLSLDRVQSLKVVSDNPANPLHMDDQGRPDSRSVNELQAMAGEWVSSNLPTMDVLVDSLCTNRSSINEALQAQLQSLLTQCHHSHNDRHQLQRLLERHWALNGQLPDDAELLGVTTARAMRRKLEAMLDAVPLAY